MNHKTYTIMPGINAGMLTLEDLERLTDIVRRYEVPATKITGAQRFAFLGLAPERLEALKEELHLPERPPHTRNQVHYVQACPGSRWCKYGKGDALSLGEAIGRLRLQGPLPYKVKVGVSGCRMCCCESWMRDVGLTMESKGWRLTFGGNAAGTPRIGDVVATGLNDQQAVDLVEKTLNFYIEKAKYKTRSARFMERFGIETLRKGVLEE